MARRLGLFDFTLITVGVIIGSGIFRNPAVVASRAHTPLLVMLAWTAGGVLALIGACVFAELAARRPETGGTYAYLRDSLGPGFGFVYVWMDFWLVFTGATAAAAVLFAGYVVPALGITADTRIVAVVTLACVTLINVFGVKQGAAWQNLLVILKLGAIAALIVGGFIAHPLPQHATPAGFGSAAALLPAFGFAMLPALYAYLGFQSAAYISGEVIDPGRTVARGLLAGVTIVVVVYLLVSAGCLRVLGPANLAVSMAPAADVMRAAFGEIGARAIAIAIGLSTLGYMSSAVLVAPRIYFKLAEDGLLFRPIAWVHPRTRVPVVAIVLHGIMSAILAASGTFAQIINWVTLPVWIFIALAACGLFVLRRRDAGKPPPAVLVPGHPWTTCVLILAVAGITASELVMAPRDSIYGILVAVVGAIAYAIIARRRPLTAHASVLPSG